MLLASQLVLILVLLSVGIVLGRPRNVPAVTDGMERMYIPNWVRWTFYLIALGSAILTIFLGGDDTKKNFLFGQIIPVCLGFFFIFCSRYFIEIRHSDVLIGRIFGTQSIPISNIKKVIVGNPIRGAKSFSAYDERGSRLFKITDNVEDYSYVIGQLKAKLKDGVVLETPGWLSKTKTVVHHKHEEQ